MGRVNFKFSKDERLKGGLLTVGLVFPRVVSTRRCCSCRVCSPRHIRMRLVFYHLDFGITKVIHGRSAKNSVGVSGGLRDEPTVAREVEGSFP